ncbi:hypothetical protein F6455_13285 [Proteobacteria bacterium 005FR1]|nr:hypothetical protein [Proteobacteria bacterium 005FR1]
MPETIGRIRKLLEESEHISDTKAFDEWAARADDIRSLRNYYVHATWDYLPLRSDAPLDFRIPPWRTEKIGDRSQGSMRLEELEADAERVESVFEEFQAIRKQYRV